MQRNAHAFLDAISTGDQGRVSKTFKDFKSNPKFADEFTDTTLLILIESEKPIKAKILGNLIVAMSNGNITTSEFDDLSLIIMSASIPAINALSEFFNSNSGKAFKHGQHIQQEPLLLSMGICSRNGTLFAISDLGQKLFKYGTDNIMKANSGLAD